MSTRPSAAMSSSARFPGPLQIVLTFPERDTAESVLRLPSDHSVNQTSSSFADQARPVHRRPVARTRALPDGSSTTMSPGGGSSGQANPIRFSKKASEASRRENRGQSRPFAVRSRLPGGDSSIQSAFETLTEASSPDVGFQSAASTVGWISRAPPPLAGTRARFPG